ncbi:DUF4193 family protein [Mycobacterium sp.]|uniref:DUF4193 family protein n=1 Tax=Mycobacterium sp. TaxID=1785 RepID=UPI002B7B1D6F|nr:DUF4193 family protein [Mycobacterium sp.]HTY30941.1 DUF4193 family protein [Mycobacterium sp.]
MRTRRQPQSPASDRKASQAASRDYDDNRRRIEEPLDEMLAGRDLAARWADIDDSEESGMERAVELAGGDVIGEDIFVPIAPKQANEFTCSSCFLIHHMSRLASSHGGRRICTDCA